MDATFTWECGYSPQLAQEPAVLLAKFGDGYEQRAVAGINTLPHSWTVSFNNIPNATADAILAFLREHAGVYAFNWAPPREESTPIVVKCSSWHRQIDGPSWSSIFATFEQVFEPAP